MTNKDLWEMMCPNFSFCPQGDGKEKAFQMLNMGYGDPRRKYRTWEIVHRRFKAYGYLAHMTKNTAAVELAIFFRDLVYFPISITGRTNARMVLEVLGQFLPRKISMRAARLVLYSFQIPHPRPSDARVIKDVMRYDLGAPKEKFETYFRAMYQEYESYGVEEYFAAEHLRHFQMILSQSHIYANQLFHERYETQARLNLERAVRMME